MTATVQALVNQPYKYGFVTPIEADVIPKGLNEEIIRLISAKKQEPEFMLEFRLRAYRQWLKMTPPTWAEVHYPPIDYQDIIYYSAPKSSQKKKSLEEVDPELLETFEKLGIPLSEQKRLANVAVDAIFDSVSIATTFKKDLAKVGVIFCSISEALREYPELVKKYLGSVVPIGDNYYAALNSAVFSDGSFVYIPKGVRCPMELSTYFRINNGESGQFERTLIIAEEGSYVSYLEGCHPAGEQVSTPDGWVNIESLKPGDQVYDHEGNPQKVRAVMVRHYKGDMLTVCPVSSYNAFRLTTEHPVLVIKGRDVLQKRSTRNGWLPEVDTEKLKQAQPQWVKAEELEKGDFLLVPKLRARENQVFSNLGYYWAEDSTYYNHLNKQHTNQFFFGLHEGDLAEGTRELVRSITGRPVYLTEQPDCILLDAYLVGDGNICQRQGSTMVRYCTTQMLLNRLGIYSWIQTRPEGAGKFAHQSDRIMQRQPLYQVGYTPNKKWDVIQETDTHFLVPIREITREPWDDLVFNIDVAETHSYLVRGFAVHNCTAPMFDTNQLHAAVVELVALDNAEIKYSTVQNWYAGDANGKGGIYNFVTKRGLCQGVNSKISWTQVETGSAITWKYPSCVLVGDNSVGEFYSVALTNNYQQADTGTKMIHIGRNTRSKIISKGISAGHSRNSYRGLVKVGPKADGARSFAQCDSMLIGDNSQANTFPYIEVKNPTAKVEHEASVSKIGEEQLFYFQQRGIDPEQAVSMMISGFCREVFNALPMEFAVEADKLLALKLEGSVG